MLIMDNKERQVEFFRMVQLRLFLQSRKEIQTTSTAINSYDPKETAKSDYTSTIDINSVTK